MTGLELARRYCDEVVLPAYRRHAPAEVEQLAFGLAGPGSECFGFDDEYSQDHDWGPRVCIWVSSSLHQKAGGRLQRIYDELDGTVAGYGPAQRLDRTAPRDGVIAIPVFLRTWLGTDSLPAGTAQWLPLPEQGLALCTNGAVFHDGPGEFTVARERLGAFYPRDIVLKKLASRCRAIGRIGQYDLWRGLQRGDPVLTTLQVATLCREIASVPYHLHGRYRPFDKWLFRGLRELSEEAKRLYSMLREIAVPPSLPSLRTTVPACIGAVEEMLAAGDLGDAAHMPMLERAAQIEQLIGDAWLREGIPTLE